MTQIHRREMLMFLVGSAVVGAVGSELMPVLAESAPLMIGERSTMALENPVEQASAQRAERACRRRHGRRMCRWRRRR
jgi:hypothetical protein